ncbi:hypothetical protein [Anaerotignum sp.]|uniref:hypothetical protein n=1 Tax=Anaerotignum sp. TaxID=2039241 RepID=UPI0028AE9775|nr:hypothetical protein [Anaerotignum sp.]
MQSFSCAVGKWRWLLFCVMFFLNTRVTDGSGFIIAVIHHLILGYFIICWGEGDVFGLADSKKGIGGRMFRKMGDFLMNQERKIFLHCLWSGYYVKLYAAPIMTYGIKLKEKQEVFSKKKSLKHNCFRLFSASDRSP